MQDMTEIKEQISQLNKNNAVKNNAVKDVVPETM